MISSPGPVEDPHPYQRQEPPAFWMIVLAGSLLIHLLALLGMRSLFLQTVQVPVEPEPMAIEFTDSTDQIPAAPAGKPNEAVAPVAAPNPAPAAASPITSASTPLAESIDTNLQTPLSPTDTTLSPLPSAPSAPSAPAPKPPVLARPKPVPPSALTPANPASSAGKPTEPLPPLSNGSLTNDRSTNATVQGPVASGILLPDVPNVPNPADNPGQPSQSSRPLIKPLLVNKAPTPARFLAQVQIMPEIEKSAIANAPILIPAVIQGEASREFISDTSTCLLTPEALSAFGKSVVINVALDDQGKIQSQPTVLDENSSGNPRYDELATCVLKQWTFSPVYEQVEDTRLAKPANLQVQVKITE